MASFVGKTGSSRQTRAILHTVSYLLNILSNYRRELCSNGPLYSYIFLKLYVIHFYVDLYQLYV